MRRTISKIPSREDEQPRRLSRPGDEKEQSGSFSYFLSQVHLVELPAPGGRPPAAHERCRAFGLARMRKAGFNLLAQHLAHLDLECGLQAPEAPRLRVLVWGAGLGKGQWIPCAGPRRVERHAPDDPMVGMKSVGDIGIERQQYIGLRGPDLADEFLTQLEAFDQLGIRVAQKGDSFHAQHVRGHLLLALADSRPVRARLGRVARALVSGCGEHEIDDRAMAGHEKNGAGTVVLDVVRVRDDAQRAPDAPVLWSAEQLWHYFLDSCSSSCARATAFAVTPPLIIRASSRARSSSEVSSRTDTTFRPSAPGDFSTSRW